MKVGWIFFLGLLIVFSWSSQPLRLVKVLDGDTVEVRMFGLKNQRVRLVGIDAPEMGQNLADASRDFVIQRCAGKKIKIEDFGYGRYNRLLGLLYCGPENINLSLIKVGLAETYILTGLPKELKSQFRTAEEEAKKSQRGVWALGEEEYIQPSIYRRLHN